MRIAQWPEVILEWPCGPNVIAVEGDVFPAERVAWLSCHPGFERFIKAGSELSSNDLAKALLAAVTSASSSRNEPAGCVRSGRRSFGQR